MRQTLVSLGLVVWVSLVGWPLAGPVDAVAQSIEHDLSTRVVEIRPTFKGTQLLLFGSIAPQHTNNKIDPARPLDVVVILRGPPRTFTVRRKERIYGMWLNRQGERLSNVPGFYFVASTGPLDVIAAPSVLMRYGIGPGQWDLAIVPPLEDKETDKKPATEPQADAQTVPAGQPLPMRGNAMFPKESDPVRQALRRSLTRSQTLIEAEGTVVFVGQHLFRTEINMPAVVPQGIYSVEVYLLQDQAVVDTQVSTIEVDKKGLERTISELAEEHSIFYGILGVVLAVFAGWLSAVIFQRV